MVDTTLLNEAAQVLSKCGRPTLPDRVDAVLLPKSFFVQNVIAAYADQTQSVQIDTDSTWLMRGLRSNALGTGVGNVWVQIRTPKGDYLTNALENMQLLDSPFPGQRIVFDPEIECAPGSTIELHWHNIDQYANPVNLILEGAVRYYLRAHGPSQPKDLPAARIVRGGAQNILAPGAGECA